jgi:hypothetical protein
MDAQMKNEQLQLVFNAKVKELDNELALLQAENRKVDERKKEMAQRGKELD